jgi:hypothetical protein
MFVCSDLHENSQTLTKPCDGNFGRRRTRLDPVQITLSTDTQILLYCVPEAPPGGNVDLVSLREYPLAKHHTRANFQAKTMSRSIITLGFCSLPPNCAPPSKEELTDISCGRFYLLAGACILYHWSQIEPVILIITWLLLLVGITIDY